MAHFVRNWWVEILIAVLILLAIFLLVERMSIRATLYTWLMGLLAGLKSLAIGLSGGLAGLARRLTLSDLIAYLLLVAVAGLVAWRTRRRLTTNPRYTDILCPRCGSDLHRTHRHWHDRLLNLFVPVRRYRCQNRECGWRGLRVRRYD